LDQLFWLTLLVMFSATIVGGLIRWLTKDKCLRLLDDYHVTYLTGEGRPLWGDLTVSSQGLELRYDAPYVTSRGLVKTSYLVYPDDWGGALALCRTEHGLAEFERSQREAQVRASFNPGRARRLLRVFSNLVNTVRDAIAKAIGLFIGRIASFGMVGKAVGDRGAEVGQLGHSLVGTMANAYEPLLERHIGRPVVVLVQNGPGAPEPVSEFPGYLVDYTENFLAVFNTEHTRDEDFELDTAETASRPGMNVELDDRRVDIRCTGPDALVVESVEAGRRALDLGVVLLPGCVLSISRDAGASVNLSAFRTRRIDLVCPRSRARIGFGSAEQPDPARQVRDGARGGRDGRR